MIVAGAAGADGEGLAPDDVAGLDRRWGRRRRLRADAARPIAAGLDGEGLAPVGAAGAGLVPLRWADAAVVVVVSEPTRAWM